MKCHHLLRGLTQKSFPPDILIDIKASPELSMERISQRGREVEASLTNSWFERFKLTHESQKSKWPAISTIEISADEKDFIQDPEKLKELAQEIIDRLYS